MSGVLRLKDRFGTEMNGPTSIDQVAEFDDGAKEALATRRHERLHLVPNASDAPAGILEVMKKREADEKSGKMFREPPPGEYSTLEAWYEAAFELSDNPLENERRDAIASFKLQWVDAGHDALNVDRAVAQIDRDPRLAYGGINDFIGELSERAAALESNQRKPKASAAAVSL